MRSFGFHMKAWSAPLKICRCSEIDSRTVSSDEPRNALPKVSARISSVTAWIPRRIAFAASDVDRIVSFYAPDALFIGTSSKSVVTETIGIRTYFERTLSTDRPRGAPISEKFVKILSEDAVLVTGLNTSTGVRDGKPYANSGRITFVISKRDDGWKIVHMHRSAMPN
jgi:uncharacterized protein (TIGR02246 family)